MKITEYKVRVTTCDNGETTEEWFNEDGQLHRETDAAGIWYDENGDVEYEQYYIDGKELTKEEFNNYRQQKEVVSTLKQNLLDFLEGLEKDLEKGGKIDPLRLEIIKDQFTEFI